MSSNFTSKPMLYKFGYNPIQRKILGPPTRGDYRAAGARFYELSQRVTMYLNRNRNKIAKPLERSLDWHRKYWANMSHKCFNISNKASVRALGPNLSRADKTYYWKRGFWTGDTLWREFRSNKNLPYY